MKRFNMLICVVVALSFWGPDWGLPEPSQAGIVSFRRALAVASFTPYGYTGNGNTEDGSDDCKVAYSAGAFGGTTGSHISRITWRGRVASGPATYNVTVGIYSESGGLPSTLLEAFTASFALTTSMQTFSQDVVGTYSLQNGTTYWIAMASTRGSGWVNAMDNTTSTYSYQCGFSTLSAGDDPWSSAGSGTGRFAAYVSY